MTSQGHRRDRVGGRWVSGGDEHAARRPRRHHLEVASRRTSIEREMLPVSAATPIWPYLLERGPSRAWASRRRRPLDPCVPLDDGLVYSRAWHTWWLGRRAIGCPCRSGRRRGLHRPG